MSLLQIDTISTAYQELQITPHERSCVAALVKAVQEAYFPEAFLRDHSKPCHNINELAIWTYDIVDADAEKLESHLYEECRRYLADGRNNERGSCYGIAITGSYWRVFKCTALEPGLPRWISLTVDPFGDPELQHYIDIGSKVEGPLIDAILRDIRESWGYGVFDPAYRPDADRIPLVSTGIY